jgi:predicted DNA-binding transcriptional regulator YafY
MVYQEEKLSVITERDNETQLPEDVRRDHMVMSEAICTHQSVMFKKSFHRAGAQSAKAVYFMPKRLLFEGGKFFAVGYHHAGERIETVDLHEIAEIQLVQLHSPKTAKKAEQVLNEYKSQ